MSRAASVSATTRLAESFPLGLTSIIRIFFMVIYLSLTFGVNAVQAA